MIAGFLPGSIFHHRDHDGDVSKRNRALVCEILKPGLLTRSADVWGSAVADLFDEDVDLAVQFFRLRSQALGGRECFFRPFAGPL